MIYKRPPGILAALHPIAFGVVMTVNWMVGLAFTLHAIFYAGMLIFPAECGLWDAHSRIAFIPIIYAALWLSASVRALNNPDRIKWLIIWMAGGLLVAYLPHLVPPSDPCYGNPYDQTGKRKTGNFWFIG